MPKPENLMSIQQPLLGRCGDCDFAVFVAPEEDPKAAERYRDMDEIGVAYVMNGYYYARCPNRHRPFYLTRVKGTYSEVHKCDSRCLMARGPECKCSCGGINHGRGYAVTEIHKAGEVAPEAPKPVDRLLGEVGKHIRGKARIIHSQDLPDATLYVFITLDGSAKIKWFAPSYANPDWPVGQVLEFRAKVKRHEDNEYGKATVVTYLEETNDKSAGAAS